MKTIKNDYLIRMFVSNDSLRPAMMNVSLQDDFLYATNAHMACKIKADLCIKKYEAIENYPNVEAVFKRHVSIETKTISVNDLFNDLMKIEVCFKPKMIECNDCYGKGVYTCDHCDSECECKNCSGSGKVPGEEMILSGEYDCVIFGRKYKLQYLDLIIKTAIYSEVKEITISNAENYSGTIFNVGDFTILLVPLITN
jgi:hypothetical protein